MKKEIILRKDYLFNAQTLLPPLRGGLGRGPALSGICNSARKKTFQTSRESRHCGLDKIGLETLYFGGGTPSLLSIDEISSFFDTINQYYELLPNAEITFEANPDDLTDEYLNGLLQLGFNRLTIGVQSFFDDDLQWMNRRHNARQALQSIENARKHGFHNINIDLLYGLPSITQGSVGRHCGLDSQPPKSFSVSENRWKANLKQAIALDVPHLSAYHIIIEPQTVFHVRQKKGETLEIPEEESVAQFNDLMDIMEKAGYEHYEISNFARPGFRSRHNTAYWQQQPYIGIGPSAHSYDGQSRQWNISNNNQYIAALEKPITHHAQKEKRCEWFEREQLTVAEQYNDYILISIRTAWGTDSNYIRTHFGDTFANEFFRQADKQTQNGFMQQQSGIYTLTRKGKMIAERIAADLFVENETNV